MYSHAMTGAAAILVQAQLGMKSGARLSVLDLKARAI